MAALNIWLGGLVERQGREELDLAARRHMALSEARIARAVAALDDLAARGIDSCRVANVDALRQATFATTPVKELSIVAPDGRTLCTDVGNQPEQRKVVSSEPLSAGSRNLLEVVRLGGQPEQWLRIRRPGAGTGNGVAALIPAALFVPQVSTGRRAAELPCPDADRRRRGDRRGGRARRRAPTATTSSSPICRPAATRSRRSYRRRMPSLPPTRAICAHWERSPAGCLPSSFLRFRSCCRDASATIRSPRSSARSRPASSCRTSSRSSTSARAGCAAPRC